MYTAYYGFHEKPFALSPDPRYLFLSDTHREVLGHLVYGIEQGEGFMAISGEVGTGKTTLCRTLLDRLGSSCEIAFLFNPMLSPTELIRAINHEFDISRFGESRTELLDVLNTFLLEKHDEGRRVLVIIDEAQNLPDETLEQLRMLSNLEIHTSKLLQIVLIGQPELDEKLGTHALRQLRQRISVWWSLGPMRRSETAEYVRHRLRVGSGGDRPIFTRSALAHIHRYSRGVPRVINVLCDRCLLAGYGERTAQIGTRIVRQVAREIRVDRSPSWLPSRAVVATACGIFAAAIASAVLLRGDGAPTTTSAEAPVLPRVSMPPPRRAPLPAAPPAALPSPRTEGEMGTGLLDGLFSLQSDAEANRSTLEALLDAWGLPVEQTNAATFEAVLAGIEARGLRTLALSSIDEMRALDVPVVIRLVDSGGSARAALVRRLVRGAADIAGLVPDQVVRLQRADFDAHWEPPGYAVWRDPTPLPGILSEGMSGPSVIWLQRQLSRLGHYGGSMHGHYDANTTTAVEWFQQARGLPADGLVGPRTQVHLLRALPEYRMPTLVMGAASPGASAP
jgi:general secretion pathway protein A